MKVFGTAKITVDGQVLLMRDGASFEPGGVNRTTVKSLQNVDGYTEEPAQSKLEGDITWTKDMSVDAIRNWSDVTVQFEADTGQTYIVRNAWSLNPPPLTTGSNGSAKITIEGPPAEELRAG